MFRGADGVGCVGHLPAHLDLTGMALAADARHREALEVRIQALKVLDAKATNSNERGWLAAGIRAAEARLKEAR